MIRQMKHDPIEYPKVSIGGKEYEVKYRVGDVILLKKQFGIDILKERKDAESDEALNHTVTMLAVGISHATGNTGQALTESISALSFQIDFAELPIYMAAVRDAQKKASERINLLMIETGFTLPAATSTLTQ